MKIIAKSAMKLNQMDNKIKLGADGIEIQLLDELLKNKPYNQCLKDLGACLNYPVFSVHSPLLSYCGSNVEVQLEMLITPSYRELFKKICQTADLYGKLQNKQVWIVIHTGLSAKTFDNENQDLIKDIIFVLKETIKEFSCVGFAIENVTPIKNIDSEGNFTTSNNFTFDNVKLVRILRKELGKEKVCTVLDTCHAEISVKFANTIGKWIDNYKIREYTLDDYFRENQDVIGFIHMSKTVLNGCGNKRHGQPFKDTPEDKQIVHNYMELYKKYNYSCPIVLEVAETDHNISDGFKESLKVLKEEIKSN